MDESTLEPERYESAAGWDPHARTEREMERLRDKARRDYEMTPNANDTMLAMRPASHWILPRRQRRQPIELLSSLWRTGEIAVMFGPRSVGKSVFAVQIADAIAKGNSPLNSPQFFKQKRKPQKGDRRPPNVLYLDFELDSRQFSERYSVDSKRRPSFAFDRAEIASDFDIPKAFRNATDFLDHSIKWAIAGDNTDVVIIDSIHYLLRNSSSSTAALNLMKTLRLICAQNGTSVLITAPMRERTRKTRPVELRDIAVDRHIAELADTVFALNTSTYGPEFRYLKHLTSRHTPIIHNAENALGFQFLAGSSSDCQLQLPTATDTLPSLLFLGPTQEHFHQTDYAKIAERELDRQAQRLKRINGSSKEFLINGILDNSYARYLER